ncbi:MAG TPA: TonB-dependent receptor [Pseudoxanthomonas sp.]|nr:TonB-dependent receptor [Pseudoxanthomonas sp.]
MNHRKSLLSVAVATGLAFSLQLHAQEAAPAPTPDQATELDTVTVTGIRLSLQKSLETKRNADAIVDAITAEDIGKFPDTNVAESLSHLPGVTVDRLFGQGERVSILGTDPALNRTLLNGQTVASADWFILDQPGRTFNYTLLAPQVIGRAEVYKTPEARIDEGSIGGTVILHTVKPLDVEANTISGSVGYLYNDRASEGDPNISGMFSWRNDAKTFGFNIGVQQSTENIQREGVESYGTMAASAFQPSIDNGTCAGECAAAIAANPNARGPNAIGTSFFQQERKRLGYSLGVQWKPVDKLELEFNALDVSADYDNVNQSMYTFPANEWNSLGRLDSINIQNGIIKQAHFTNALSVLDVQNRESEVNTDSYNLKGAWRDEAWSLSAEVGRTKADGGTGRQLFGEFLNWADYSFDITGARGTPVQINYDDPTVTQNGDNWVTDPGWGGNLVTKPTTDEEKYGQIDFGLNFNSAISRVQFGYKRREHETSQYQDGWTLNGVAWAASQFGARRAPDGYLDGFGLVSDEMRNRIIINGWALADAIADRGLTNAPVYHFYEETWKVTEDIDAYYAQADFSAGGFRGNFGARYVRTDQTSTGYNRDPNDATGATYIPVSYSKSYNDVLPNVNVAYDLGEDVVLRASAAKVIARANYASLTPFLSLSDTVHTGWGGNPNLDPYESTNIDASAEWYYAENSILAANVFYKDISNYILDTTFTEQHFNMTTGTVDTYSVSRPGNGGTATVKGISLSYQQLYGEGFGLTANYTYSDAGTDSGRDLPYNSKNQLNISPFFENDKWSARVTYAWRSSYFTGVDRGDQMYSDDYTSVDASVGYQISDNWRLSFDAMNLLDEKYFNYANTTELPRGIYRSGRRYQAQVQFKF